MATEHKVLAVTGHRPDKLYGYDLSDERYARLSDKLRTLIGQAYRHGYRHFVSGMAQGADMLFAREVVNLRKTREDVRLVAAVPLILQSDRWPKEAKEEWESILRHCTRIFVINSGRELRYAELKKHLELCSRGKSNPEVGADYESRFFGERNQWMVNKADCLLAVWNGQRSGTGDTVKRAQEKGIKVVKLDPLTLEVRTI